VAKKIGIAAALLLLAAGGGMQFYTAPLWAMLVLLALLLLAVALLAGADLRAALVLFATYWPLALLFLQDTTHWWGNRNIYSVWLAVAVLALLTDRRRLSWLPIGLAVALLLWHGSRGAALGLWVGLLVMLWPWTAARRVLWAALLAAPLLLWWRPETAIYRLWYWQQAMAAWWSSPWLGVGFGGLQSGCWIPEPGGGCQIHAHNMFVHVAAEFGAVGAVGLLVGLIAALGMVSRPRWNWALLAALLAHSMVDMPLLWPGPMALFVVLLIYPYQFFVPYKKFAGVVTKNLVVFSYSRRNS